jgi:NAD(P)-dependent dehydrogenase (short-subunit alcohol dehydrogenase family)
MLTDLKGTVVCVTGAARRVGRALLLAFAEQGAHVVIHHGSSDNEAATVAEAARACGVESRIIKADLTDPTAIARMFEAIRAHFGRLDVLVNSAASFEQAPLLDISPEAWDRVLNTNLRAPFLCTQQAAHLMIAGGRGGCIINIADNSGVQGWASRTHHSISKAGLLMLCRVAAQALAPHNIRVNGIIPGPVLLPEDSPPSLSEKITATLLLGRIGTPQDVARAAVFLATNDFITGAMVPVDGGEGLDGFET